MDYSPPGSSVLGILQARTLDWVVMPSSMASSRPRDWTCVSYISCIGTRILYGWRHLGSPASALCLYKTFPKWQHGSLHLNPTKCSACGVRTPASLLGVWGPGTWQADGASLYGQPPVTDCHCSVAKSCPTLWDPKNCSTPGFPVLHYLPEFAQTHVHWGGDAILLSHPVIPFSSCLQSFPASGSFLMSWVFPSGGASVSALLVNIQDWFPLGWTGLLSLRSKGLSSLLQHHSSKASALSLLYVMDPRSLMRFPGRQCFTHVATTCRKIKCVLCDSTRGPGVWEGNSWKPVPGFLWTLPHMPSPFTDFALYPFATKNGYEYNCVPSQET